MNKDIAVLKNDLEWIKKEISEIKDITKGTKACVYEHNNRLQRLEDWKKGSDESFNKNMKKWGLIISIISIACSIIIGLVSRIMIK